jgi:hypothetical protein
MGLAPTTERRPAEPCANPPRRRIERVWSTAGRENLNVSCCGLVELQVVAAACTLALVFALVLRSPDSGATGQDLSGPGVWSLVLSS